MMDYDIIAEIAAFEPFDAGEARDRERFLALVAQSSDPVDRTVYEPGHITSSAFVVSGTARKILLVFHRKLRRWLQPGGHVEAGDASLKAAACRELLEETGTQASASPVLFDLDIHEIPARRDEPAHLHFDMRYLFVVDGLPSGEAGDETATWFSEEECATLDLDPSIWRMIEKAKRQGYL